MTAQKHLEKFYDKGGKLEPTEVEVVVNDTIPGADGKDSIIERLIEVPCPEPIAPKTKWEVRFDNKRFKDSLKYIRKVYNDSLDHELKALRSSNAFLSDSLTEARKVSRYKNKTDRTTVRKENKSSWLFWLGLVVGIIITLALVCVVMRFKKFILP
tara:strand:- start:11689 stop:12156 length:468 start_codon:yes stop_codon:yes gene_type:complete